MSHTVITVLGIGLFCAAIFLSYKIGTLAGTAQTVQRLHTALLNVEYATRKIDDPNAIILQQQLQILRKSLFADYKKSMR